MLLDYVLSSISQSGSKAPACWDSSSVDGIRCGRRALADRPARGR
jgi:hypothetical protein